MRTKFHCHTISSLENTRVGQFCPPQKKVKYATPDTPNKIGLNNFLKNLRKTEQIRSYYLTCSLGVFTAQKMRFPIKDFFGKCDKIRSFLRI